MGFGGRVEGSVDETERKLRYQIQHMIVCDERAYYKITPSRVAPQEMILLSQHWIGMGVFLCIKAFIQSNKKTMETEESRLKMKSRGYPLP